jgi:hypothetical protein
MYPFLEFQFLNDRSSNWNCIHLDFGLTRRANRRADQGQDRNGH